MSIDLIVKLGLALAILIGLILVARWLYNRGQDRQALRETKERLKGQLDAQEQERQEREAFDAAGRIDLGATPGVRVCPKDSGTS